MEIINVPRASSTQRGQLIDAGRAFRRNRLLFIFANSSGKNENFKLASVDFDVCSQQKSENICCLRARNQKH